MLRPCIFDGRRRRKLLQGDGASSAFNRPMRRTPAGAEVNQPLQANRAQAPTRCPSIPLCAGCIRKRACCPRRADGARPHRCRARPAQPLQANRAQAPTRCPSIPLCAGCIRKRACCPRRADGARPHRCRARPALPRWRRWTAPRRSRHRRRWPRARHP